MSKTLKKIRRDGLTRLVALAAGCVLASLANAEKAAAQSWSFVVAGDDRTNPTNADSTGINRPVLTNLLHAIARDKPEFMLFTGDLVLGSNSAVPLKVGDQLNIWKEIVRVELPGVTVLPMRGNHETKGDADGEVWKTAFKTDLDHVAGLKYFKGEEGFSYSYSPPAHPETLIIGFDQYMANQTHRVNLAELENALKTRPASAGNIFVFSHEMAFASGHHTDAESMAAFPKERDDFIDLLQHYGCRYFLAGHDHLYDWMEIRRGNWPADYVLNQIVAGTAGAPLYEDKGYFGDHGGYDLKRREHFQQTFGYVLVTVNGTNATAKFVPVGGQK